MKFGLVIFLVGSFCSIAFALDQVPETTLPRVDSSWTTDGVRDYVSRLDNIVAHPKALYALDMMDVEKLLDNIDYDVIKDKLPLEESLKDLRQTETKLVGLIILSLQSRVDPSVDFSSMNLYRTSYPTYDSLYPDPDDQKNDALRKAYNDYINAKMKTYQHLIDQRQLNQKLDHCLMVGNRFLSIMYATLPAQKAEESSSLREVGLDQNTIEMLTKPESNLVLHTDPPTFY